MGSKNWGKEMHQEGHTLTMVLRILEKEAPN
jgi:hypothetical protein